MRRDCSSGKHGYDSAELAREGLIQILSGGTFPEGQGPRGIYQCRECGCYHLTSAEGAEITLDAEDNLRIKKLREARFWEERFRRK